MIEFKRIYEDEDWEVLIPENFPTSKWIGGGWCSSLNEKDFNTLLKMHCILFRILYKGIPYVRLTWSKKTWSFALPNRPAIFSDFEYPFADSVLKPTHKYSRDYLDKNALPIFNKIKHLPDSLKLAIIEYKQNQHDCN